ncbi:MAG: hypothetical protein QCI82_06025 [Candidatus Thermoplasmatota archaeon]|nr:hypothetical protein [Candidatus Thermoplasmatota archaeon]
MNGNQLSNFLRVTDEQGSHIHVKVSGEAFLRTFTSLIEKQTQVAKRKGILISTLWSANALSRRVSLSNLPKNSLRIIDTVTMSLGSKETEIPNIITLPAPASLESILIEIERLMTEGKEEYSFLIIDSLGALSMDHPHSVMFEFFKYLTNRLLEEDVTFIIFDQDLDGTAAISRSISTLMDHNINMMKVEK